MLFHTRDFTGKPILKSTQIANSGIKLFTELSKLKFTCNLHVKMGSPVLKPEVKKDHRFYILTQLLMIPKTVPQNTGSITCIVYSNAD